MDVAELSPWLGSAADQLPDPVLLDAVLESTETPIVVLDRGSRFVRYNQAAARSALARWNVALRPGINLAEVIPEGTYRDTMLEEFRDALTGVTCRRQLWMDAADGGRLLREIVTSPVRGGQGDVVAVMITAPLVDASGDRGPTIPPIQLEETAQVATPAFRPHPHGAFRMMFHEAPLGMVVLRLDGVIEEVNGAFARFLGSSVERLIGRSINDVTYSEDRGISPLNALARGGLTRYEVTKRYLRDDGRPVRGKVTAVRLPEDPPRLLGIIEDIDTAEKEEVAAHAIDARGRAIFEAQADGVALLTREGYVLEANRAMAAMQGRTREQMVGLHISEFDVGQSRNEMAARIDKALHGPVRLDSIHRRLDGTTYPARLAVTPLVLGGQLHLCCSAQDISQERANETTRQCSDALYRQLVDSSPNITFTFSTVRGGLFYSPQVETILGYTPGELVSHPRLWSDSIHPDDRPATEASMAAMERNGWFDVEHRIRHKNGSWCWLREWSASIERAGEELIVVGQAMDLTSLRQQEAKFQRLVENSPDIIYRWERSPTPGFVYVSPAVTAMTGYTPLELIADPQLMESRIHPEDRTRLAATRGSTAPEHRALRIRFQHREGRELWLEIQRTPLEDGGATEVAIEGVVRDVTARVAAEQQSLMLAAALKQAAEVVIITDRTGAIIDVNQAFERVTGYSREEALGKNPRILKSGLQGPEFYAGMWSTLKQGEPWRGGLVNRRKDGTHYSAEVVITPVRDGHGEVVNLIAMQRDITRERLLDEALRQAQKMEAVGQVTGGVAHDFNNMLTVILANANLIETELPEGSETATWLKEILSAAQHGSGMIRQLLAFGRREHLVPRPLRLTEEFSAFIPVLRRVLSEDVELSLAGSDPVWALADRTSYEQIILNLITNARDAMPQGGRVAVRTGRRTVSDAAAVESLGVLRAGEFATIAIEDSGTGMDDATLRRVFEPFFTTKPVGRGSGLGLPMVQGLMQQHQGWVEVKSAPGKGTTVTLGFPVTDPPVSRTAPQAPLVTEGCAGRGEVILVVEDEASLRRVATRTLEREGFKVITAVDGEAGWTQWNEHGNAIALVLTDAVMPRMGGPDLIRKLRASGAEVPVILMSGYSADDLHDSALTDVPVVAKPWSGPVLAAAIRQALDRTVAG